MSASTHVQTYVRSDLAAKIDEYAGDNDLSRTEVVRLALLRLGSRKPTKVEREAIRMGRGMAEASPEARQRVADGLTAASN